MIDAVVALHLRFYDHVPSTARAQMLGDSMLACVLGGIRTDPERLRERALTAQLESRQPTAGERALVAAVERLSGRGVIACTSDHERLPEVAVELFVLEPAAPL